MSDKAEDVEDVEDIPRWWWTPKRKNAWRVLPGHLSWRLLLLLYHLVTK